MFGGNHVATVPRHCHTQHCHALIPVVFLRIQTWVIPPFQLNTAAVQLPIGLEDSHSGVVDVVCGRAFGFSGVKGENVEEIAMPEGMKVLIPHNYSRLLPAVIGGAVDRRR